MTQFETTVLQRLEKIEKLVKNAPAPKKTWVKVSIITELTGWSSSFLRKARENGLVKYRDNDGYEYLLESIDPVFIKKQTA